jgi:hypothetical protein
MGQGVLSWTPRRVSAACPKRAPREGTRGSGAVINGRERSEGKSCSDLRKHTFSLVGLDGIEPSTSALSVLCGARR